MSLDRVLRALKFATGATITEASTDGTMAGNSDSAVPTEKAVKTYVGTAVGAASGQAGFFIIPVSFETTEIVALSIYPAMGISITGYKANVTLAIAGTDDATVTFANSTGDMAGVLTIPASSALGYEIGENPTTNNVILTGGLLSITPAKTTKGGRAIIQVNYTVN